MCPLRRISSRPTGRPTAWSNTRRRRARAGCKVIVAGAGGAAHLPGMIASHDPPAGAAACPCSRKRARAAWTACSPSCRCRAAFRSARSPSARRARRTPGCSPPRCWRCPTKRWPTGWMPAAPRRPTPSPTCPRTKTLAATATGRADRHSGRRAAWPDAGDGRRRARPQVPYLLSGRDGAAAALSRLTSRPTPTLPGDAMARQRRCRRPASSMTCQPTARILTLPLRNCAGALALATAQDRLTEKNFLKQRGIASRALADVADTDDLASAGRDRHTGACLKTAAHGLLTARDRRQFVSATSGRLPHGRQSASCRRSSKALSISSARFRSSSRGDSDGEVAAYDPVENLHANHILDRTYAPAALTPALADEARAHRREDRLRTRLCGRDGRRDVRRPQGTSCSSTRSRRASTIPATGRWMPAR